MKMQSFKEVVDVDVLNSLGRAQEIDHEKEGKQLREITGAIKRTMRKKNLISLSAPGIGYNKRIFCIDFSDQEIKSFINPVIQYAEGIQLVREQCSSIPGKEFIVPRSPVIDVIYETPTGVIKTQRMKDVVAFVCQHEIHHLEGVTLEDIGLEIDSDWDEATEEERREVIEMYLDSLDLRQQYLDKVIEEDEELHIVSERLRFVEALAKGEIELAPNEENEEGETIEG